MTKTHRVLYCTCFSLLHTPCFVPCTLFVELWASLFHFWSSTPRSKFSQFFILLTKWTWYHCVLLFNKLNKVNWSRLKPDLSKATTSVNMYARFWLLKILSSCRTHISNECQMKWYFNLICFDLEWNVGTLWGEQHFDYCYTTLHFSPIYPESLITIPSPRKLLSLPHIMPQLWTMQQFFVALRSIHGLCFHLLTHTQMCFFSWEDQFLQDWYQHNP